MALKQSITVQSRRNVYASVLKMTRWAMIQTADVWWDSTCP